MRHVLQKSAHLRKFVVFRNRSGCCAASFWISDLPTWSCVPLWKVCLKGGGGREWSRMNKRTQTTTVKETREKRCLAIAIMRTLPSVIYVSRTSLTDPSARRPPHLWRPTLWSTNAIFFARVGAKRSKGALVTKRDGWMSGWRYTKSSSDLRMAGTSVKVVFGETCLVRSFAFFKSNVLLNQVGSFDVLHHRQIINFAPQSIISIASATVQWKQSHRTKDTQNDLRSTLCWLKRIMNIMTGPRISYFIRYMEGKFGLSRTENSFNPVAFSGINNNSSSMNYIKSNKKCFDWSKNSALNLLSSTKQMHHFLSSWNRRHHMFWTLLVLKNEIENAISWEKAIKKFDSALYVNATRQVRHRGLYGRRGNKN